MFCNDNPYCSISCMMEDEPDHKKWCDMSNEEIETTVGHEMWNWYQTRPCGKPTRAEIAVESVDFGKLARVMLIVCAAFRDTNGIELSDKRIHGLNFYVADGRARVNVNAKWSIDNPTPRVIVTLFPPYTGSATEPFERELNDIVADSRSFAEDMATQDWVFNATKNSGKG